MTDTVPFPKRITLSRTKGWRIPPCTVKVDRSTKWGNPFVVGRDGSSADCVRLYRYMIAGQLCITTKATLEEQEECYKYVWANIDDLVGQNIACWCRYDRPCHGDVLLEMARARERTRHGRRVVS